MKEAKHDLQVEVERLTAEIEGLQASALDASKLKSSIDELQAKLTDAQEKFSQQSALVCFLIGCLDLIITFQ